MNIFDAIISRRPPDSTIGMSRRQRRAYNMAQRKQEKLRRWEMRKALREAMSHVPTPEEIAEWNRLDSLPKTEVPWRIVSSKY